MDWRERSEAAWRGHAEGVFRESVGRLAADRQGQVALARLLLEPDRLARGDRRDLERPYGYQRTAWERKLSEKSAEELAPNAARLFLAAIAANRKAFDQRQAGMPSGPARDADRASYWAAQYRILADVTRAAGHQVADGVDQYAAGWAKLSDRLGQPFAEHRRVTGDLQIDAVIAAVRQGNTNLSPRDALADGIRNLHRGINAAFNRADRLAREADALTAIDGLSSLKGCRAYADAHNAYADEVAKKTAMERLHNRLVDAYVSQGGGRHDFPRLDVGDASKVDAGRHTFSGSLNRAWTQHLKENGGIPDAQRFAEDTLGAGADERKVAAFLGQKMKGLAGEGMIPDILSDAKDAVMGQRNQETAARRSMADVYAASFAGTGRPAERLSRQAPEAAPRKPTSLADIAPSPARRAEGPVNRPPSPTPERKRQSETRHWPKTQRPVGQQPEAQQRRQPEAVEEPKPKAADEGGFLRHIREMAIRAKAELTQRMEDAMATFGWSAKRSEHAVPQQPRPQQAASVKPEMKVVPKASGNGPDAVADADDIKFQKTLDALADRGLHAPGRRPSGQRPALERAEAPGFKDRDNPEPPLPKLERPAPAPALRMGRR